jgi:hypothetical protein
VTRMSRASWPAIPPRRPGQNPSVRSLQGVDDGLTFLTLQFVASKEHSVCYRLHLLVGFFQGSREAGRSKVRGLPAMDDGALDRVCSAI